MLHYQALPASSLHRTYPPRTEAGTPECNGTHPDASAVLQGQLDGLRQVTDLLRAQLEDVREDPRSTRSHKRRGANRP